MEIALLGVRSIREVSSSLEGPSIGIATRADPCSFIGLHGCPVALPALAGQRHSFPAGNHPFALEFEKRGLILSPAAASARTQARKSLAENGNGSLAAPVALLCFELGRLDKAAGLKHRSSGAA
jgi:hypothetical protein